MRRFELLSHTADVRILTEGSSPADVFTAALHGLCSVLAPEFDFESETTFSTDTVSLSSADSTALLIDFLGEALYLMYKEKAILYSCDVSIHGDNSLTVVFSGVRADGFDHDVKAVTYHEAELRINDAGNYECTIVLDI